MSKRSVIKHKHHKAREKTRAPYVLLSKTRGVFLENYSWSDIATVPPAGVGVKLFTKPDAILFRFNLSQQKLIAPEEVKLHSWRGEILRPPYGGEPGVAPFDSVELARLKNNRI